MSRKLWVWAVGMLVIAGMLASAAGASTRVENSRKLTKVTLQLKWVTQAQFAGYYAAKAKGYYEKAGLDVTIKPGGPNIVPEQVVAGGQAQFGIDWLSSLMLSRAKNVPLVSISQVFNKSGLTLLTWKDTGINTVAKMKNKKVGNWLFGNEFEVFAALAKFGMDPVHNRGVTIFQQPFDMNAFLKRQIDAASAMTYNELAQVLETKNAKTGKLYTMNALNVIKMQSVGTSMLEDNIFTTTDYLKSATNRDTAKKFVAASLQGWIYCRDHVDECTQIVLDNGPTLGKGHQTWMMNEINALAWPSKNGIGVMDKADYEQTAEIAKQFGVISKAPSADAYRTDLAQDAVDEISAEGADVNGNDYKKPAVKVTPKGA